jgi:hypothetical protein
MPVREKGQKRRIFAVAPEKKENAPFFLPFLFLWGGWKLKKGCFPASPSSEKSSDSN